MWIFTMFLKDKYLPERWVTLSDDWKQPDSPAFCYYGIFVHVNTHAGVVVS